MSFFIFEVGDSSFSNQIISDLIVNITFDNHIRNGKGLPNPYFSSSETISFHYKITDSEIGLESFRGASYHLATLVDVLVRRKKRKMLNELWKNISYLQKCEFVPKPLWKFFLWKCDEGEAIDTFYKNPQSWGELVEQDNKFNRDDFPKILLNNPFSYYFLICYPHRLNKHTAKIVDRKLWNIKL